MGQVHPEGKYVVDIDKDIDINKCTPGARAALRNDSYQLHLLLPTKVPPGRTQHLAMACGSPLVTRGCLMDHHS